MMMSSRLAFWICLCCVLSCVQHGLCAQDQASAVTADALGDTGWYDAEANQLIPIYVREQVDDSINRQSRWLPKADKVKAETTTTATAPANNTTGGNGMFGTDLTLGNLVGWMILALIVCIVVGMLVYAFSKAEIDLDEHKTRLQSDTGAPDRQTQERMKHLPAELRRTDVNLRSEAERLMQAGQFDQAIILLFGHQLLLLDRAGALRLARGKTNRRYVRETRATDRDLGNWLRQTATAFERSYFGRHQIAAPAFAVLWRSNELLEQRVQQRSEVAA